MILETILGFLIAIVVLVFVHELGHFLFAKWTGCRVDEFAVGFRPALAERMYKGTNYVLGMIPIGGYVKIWGENGSEEVEQDRDNPEAFYNRPRWAQALVLSGGILFNIILAWLCFSLLLSRGLEVSQTQFPNQELEYSQVQVINALPDYPAAEAGIEMGDTVIAISNSTGETVVSDSWEEYTDFIDQYGQEGVMLTVQDYETEEVSEYILTAEPYEDRAIVGLGLDTVGEVTLPWYQAIPEGARMTWDFSLTIIWFLGNFFGDLFTGDADTSTVSGPVGIASFAGDSFAAGFDDFIWFLAVLSLNLAIFNLLPIPALDGGRLVFVAVESVIRRPVDPKWFYRINAAGFIALLGLMVVVTVFDITKLF